MVNRIQSDRHFFGIVLQAFFFALFFFSLPFLNLSDYLYQYGFGKIISLYALIFVLWFSRSFAWRNYYLLFPIVHLALCFFLNYSLVYDSWVYLIIYLLAYFFKSCDYRINYLHLDFILSAGFLVLGVSALINVDQINRYIYPMENRNSLGLFLASGSVYFFCKCFFSKNLFERWNIFFILSFLFLGFVLFLNGSRGALLSCLFGLLVALFIKFRIKKQNDLFLIALMSFIFVLFFSFALLFFKPNFMMNLSNIGFRYEVFDGALYLWSKEWGLGYGLNKLNELVPLYWPPHAIYYEGVGDTIFHAHNEWLQLLFEYGIFGFILFVLFLASVIFKLMKNISFADEKTRGIQVFVLVGIFMILLQCSFDRIFRFPSGWLLFIGYLFLAFNCKKTNSRITMKRRIPVIILVFLYTFFVYQLLWPQREFNVAMQKVKEEDFVSAEKSTSKIASSSFNIGLQIKGLIASGNLNRKLNNHIKTEFIANDLISKNPILIHPYMLLIDLHLQKGDIKNAQSVLLNYNKKVYHLDLVNYYLSTLVKYQLKIDDQSFSIISDTLRELKKTQHLPYPTKVTATMIKEYGAELIAFFQEKGYQEYSKKIEDLLSR